MVHVFTSITSNYIPKAKVLAATLKKFHPEIQFHLLLSDSLPEDFHQGESSAEKLFDSIINITELNIPNFQSWVFKHSVVELCTAVKGFGFLEIIKRYQTDKVIYFDPDMVVLSRIDSIIEKLEQHSVLLTPHVTEPEETEDAILDNEISSLKHGVFNLGFLAIKTSDNGLAFLHWWSDRLARFCYDSIPEGLFTDQRWVDLAPCLFDDIGILREPIYNVATWNLTHRKVTGSLQDESGIKVNGQRLCFFHFSGFDSGAQLTMLNKYADNSPALYELRGWYIQFCEKMGQPQFEKITSVYNYYDNGEAVKQSHRVHFRNHRLENQYSNPYNVDSQNSYYAYLKQKNLFDSLLADSLEITKFKQSKSYRLARLLSKIVNFPKKLIKSGSLLS